MLSYFFILWAQGEQDTYFTRLMKCSALLKGIIYYIPSFFMFIRRLIAVNFGRDNNHIILLKKQNTKYPQEFLSWRPFLKNRRFFFLFKKKKLFQHFGISNLGWNRTLGIACSGQGWLHSEVKLFLASFRQIQGISNDGNSVAFLVTLFLCLTLLRISSPPAISPVLL